MQDCLSVILDEKQVREKKTAENEMGLINFKIS
jgi:hypothetical protein